MKNKMESLMAPEIKCEGEDKYYVLEKNTRAVTAFRWLFFLLIIVSIIYLIYVVSRYIVLFGHFTDFRQHLFEFKDSPMSDDLLKHHPSQKPWNAVFLFLISSLLLALAVCGAVIYWFPVKKYLDSALIPAEVKEKCVKK